MKQLDYSEIRLLMFSHKKSSQVLFHQKSFLIKKYSELKDYFKTQTSAIEKKISYLCFALYIC
jgi:hypothetical protein